MLWWRSQTLAANAWGKQVLCHGVWGLTLAMADPMRRAWARCSGDASAGVSTWSGPRWRASRRKGTARMAIRATPSSRKT